MPSPFPGMNPYLEQDDAWHDFHERFIPLAAEVLGEQLGREYIVKIDEHIYIHELPDGGGRLLGRADLAVGHLPKGPAGEGGNVATLAPARVQLPAVDVEGQSFIEIRDRHDRQLIAVIELLSPSNKWPGPDREQYLAKRGQLLRSAAHFVEIDLLRAGPRMPFTGLPDCDYYGMVSRVEERPNADVWTVRLRDPLPRIPVPLRASNARAALDLQQLVHRLYDAAHYENYIYEGAPEPPLNPDDAQWAKQFIPSPAD